MQKLIETLKGFGIEIPDDKQAEVKKTLSAHYKNVAEHEKVVAKVEAERDKWKGRAEAAESTLKGFEGKDFDTITKERDEWKKKAEDAEKDYNTKIAEREKADLLKEAFAEIKFTSESAKKAIMAQISDGITVKNGKLIGFNDLLEEVRKTDASAFVDEKQQNLEGGKARFTQHVKTAPGTTTTYTSRKEIMSIKDPGERQAAIAQNLSLFGK